MKIADHIEAAELPLEVPLPLDTDAEMQEYFHIWQSVVESP